MSGRRLAARQRLCSAEGSWLEACRVRFRAQFFRQNTWNDYRTTTNQQTWTELYFAVSGYEYAGEPYVLKVPEAARRRAAGLLGERTGPRVCLNSGGSLTTKLWPARHWAELAVALIDHGAQLAVLGGPTARRGAAAGASSKVWSPSMRSGDEAVVP
ncbi:glycosyltransferase family 9 protein [Streptomyces sp. NPDC002785]|uniref:glycosyltransferase family 9 protein n=1 Tax=Streptomyces sp. NPDC002785 TaxID=3154543 RepID=UPI0033193DE9